MDVSPSNTAILQPILGFDLHLVPVLLRIMNRLNHGRLVAPQQAREQLDLELALVESRRFSVQLELLGLSPA